MAPQLVKTPPAAEDDALQKRRLAEDDDEEDEEEGGGHEESGLSVAGKTTTTEATHFGLKATARSCAAAMAPINAGKAGKASGATPKTSKAKQNLPPPLTKVWRRLASPRRDFCVNNPERFRPARPRWPTQIGEYVVLPVYTTPDESFQHYLYVKRHDSRKEDDAIPVRPHTWRLFGRRCAPNTFMWVPLEVRCRTDGHYLWPTCRRRPARTASPDCSPSAAWWSRSPLAC